MKIFNYKRSGAFVYVNTENALHKQVQMLILPILWLVIKERFVLTLVFISKLRFLHVLKKLQLRNFEQLFENLKSLGTQRFLSCHPLHDTGGLLVPPKTWDWPCVDTNFFVKITSPTRLLHPLVDFSTPKFYSVSIGGILLSSFLNRYHLGVFVQLILRRI